MKTVMIINGAYRPDGHTDRVIAELSRLLTGAGLRVETVMLRETSIEFCHNCRECTQVPGINPPPCVIDDDMNELVERMERADGFIFAAPTNFGTATALFKRYLERLTVYGIWPWGARMPKLRKQGVVPKPALLITSCSAPAWIGRWVFHAMGELKLAARTVGATPVGRLISGQVLAPPGTALDGPTRHRVARLGQRLIKAMAT